MSNAGGRDVDLDESVSVKDVLPDELTYVSGPAGCSASGQIVECDIDPLLLPVGGSATIVLQARLVTGAPAGTYTNLAVVDTKDDPAPEDLTCPTQMASGGTRSSMAGIADPTKNVDCEDTPLLPNPVLVTPPVDLSPAGSPALPATGGPDLAVLANGILAIVVGAAFLVLDRTRRRHVGGSARVRARR